MKKKLTISLLVYNGEKYLPACLNSVFNQTFLDWELLILDNGSTDNSLSLVKDLINNNQDKARVLPPKEKNIGFAAGHNQIIKQAGGQYILILNQDVILEPDFCERIINFMEKNEKAGVAIGLIYKWNFNGARELTNESKTRIIDTAGLELRRSFQVIDSGENNSYKEEQEVFGASGCCPVYRWTALEEVSGFDKSFFCYKEDVDLAFRLRTAGWSAWLVNKAIAYHDRSVGTDSSRQRRPEFRNYLSYRNHLYVLLKNLALSDALHCGIFIGWYEFKKLIYLILFERKSLYAWIEVFKSLPRLFKQRKQAKPKSVRNWIR